MRFPMTEFIFTPRDLLEHLRAHSKLAIESLPKTALMCLSPSVAARMVKAGNWRTESALGAKWAFVSKNLVQVSGFGLGAPAAAAKIEEMKCLGVNKIVFVGTAGSLQHDLPAGGAVLLTSAQSAEGTSAHYSKKKTFSANHELLERLAAVLKVHRVTHVRGTAWSTDAPYRERRSILNRLRNAGVLAVDMEASAIFAASEALGLKAAGLVVISDELSGGRWQPHFGTPILREKFLRLMQAVTKDLS